MVKQFQAPAAKSIIDSLTAFARPVSKLSSAQAAMDPKLAARVRFANQVAEQIKRINVGEAKTRRFNKTATGVVTITLRNGNTAMQLGGTTYFECADKVAAVKFLETVLAGAKAGELDAALTETARPPRAKKDKVAVAPAVSPEADKA